MKRWRTLFQVGVLVAVIVAGFRHAMGWSRTTIETYCPFGGLETAMSLFTKQSFTCATGERNLALFLALIVLTLIARKSFCGWVCPVGAVSEWLTKLGVRLLPRKAVKGDPRTHRLEPSPRVDRALRWLRLPVLAVILILTYKTGELIFRGYDPFYILFSFHGHDVFLWSYAVLAVILAGVVIFPMAWCRYLCPLGVALWPFSAIGRLRISRSDEACTSCGLCDRVCPQSLDVSSTDQVRSGECMLCFECIEACPEEGALELRVEGLRR